MSWTELCDKSLLATVDGLMVGNWAKLGSWCLTPHFGSELGGDPSWSHQSPSSGLTLPTPTLCYENCQTQTRLKEFYSEYSPPKLPLAIKTLVYLIYHLSIYPSIHPFIYLPLTYPLKRQSVFHLSFKNLSLPLTIYLGDFYIATHVELPHFLMPWV